MSTTTDNLPEGARSVLVKLCNDRLADAVDLQLQCKHAYWNTVDPSLATLRELFDTLNESVEDHIDRIAERAVELGGAANSTEHVVATWSHVLCSPDAICRNHAPTIAAALGSFGFLTRHAVDTCKELGDVVSAQLFTTISQDTDKWHRTFGAL